MSHADLDAGAEARALGLHLREARLEVLLLHLEVGDAVAQQAADAVVALEHGDRVAGAGELLGGGEAGGAGADDGDGLAGEALRRVRGRPSRSRTPGR